MLSLLPSAAAMRAADAAAMEAGLPAFALMENAGRAAGVFLAAAHPDSQAVLVACGRGGNGGDGLVVARVLAEAGHDVDVWMAHPPDALRPDAAAHHALLLALAPHLRGRVRFVDGGTAEASYPLGVDALLGTGQTGPLRPPEARGAALLAARAARRYALDLPTGVDADTGAAAEGAVSAHATLAFAAAKPGHFLGAGAALAGAVHVLPVGVPDGLIEAAMRAHGGAYRSTDTWARAVQPVRPAETHKYAAGTVLVVAGSPAYLGAPRLAAEAAARAGAGYVQLATPAPAAALLAPVLPDVPVLALAVGSDGALDAGAAVAATSDARGRAGALVIGPGLGRLPGTLAAVRALLAAFDGPCVVDADALSALRDGDLAGQAQGRWVLTPHAGELARLLGEAPDLSDRVALARALAARWNAVVVLKGLPSLVAAPDGRVALSAPHSPALATAGTGDVLAGLAGGFLAQGLAPFEAALLALHTGGRAALAWAARRQPASMQASDLLRLVPRVLAPRA